MRRQAKMALQRPSHFAQTEAFQLWQFPDGQSYVRVWPADFSSEACRRAQRSVVRYAFDRLLRTGGAVPRWIQLPLHGNSADGPCSTSRMVLPSWADQNLSCSTESPSTPLRENGRKSTTYVASSFTMVSSRHSKRTAKQQGPSHPRPS